MNRFENDMTLRMEREIATLNQIIIEMQHCIDGYALLMRGVKDGVCPACGEEHESVCPDCERVYKNSDTYCISCGHIRPNGGKKDY